MAQTLAEKLVARAAGRAAVVPGEIVTCRVDLAMVHDSSGPRRLAPMLERLGVGVWDPDRLVVKRALADDARTLKRFRARSRGRVSPMLRRYSHIEIVVEGDEGF